MWRGNGESGITDVNSSSPWQIREHFTLLV
jgi:hypothetical protein